MHKHTSAHRYVYKYTYAYTNARMYAQIKIISNDYFSHTKNECDDWRIIIIPNNDWRSKYQTNAFSIKPSLDNWLLLFYRLASRCLVSTSLQNSLVVWLVLSLQTIRFVVWLVLVYKLVVPYLASTSYRLVYLACIMLQIVVSLYG